MIQQILIGVDGGGSKTLALATDLQGNLLGRGLGGPSNYHTAGVQAAYQALEQAIMAAVDHTSLADAQIAAICFGLGGVDTPQDEQVILSWTGRRFPGLPVQVVNDAHLVLAGGTPDDWGVGVISGTGSIAFGRAPDGRTARAGGWGHLLGDEGSGYAIGLAALRAVARTWDGRGEATLLTEAILTFWDLPTPEHLIGHVYQKEIGRPEIARLAKLVDTAAGQGDAVAAQIVTEAGHELALAAGSVVRQLELPAPVPCGLGGSLLTRGENMRLAFETAARQQGLRLQPVEMVPEPAIGAVRLAQRLISSASG